MSKYSSFYELLHGAESIPHTSHLVEHFSGDALDAKWTETNTGSGTNTINDAIDGGLIMTTGATTNNNNIINFNNIKQYDPTNSIVVGVIKNVASLSRLQQFGLHDSTSFENFILMFNDTDLTYYGINSTKNNDPTTSIESTLPIDELWHIHKFDLSLSNAELLIDNTLEVTKTENLPTTKQQPINRILTRTTSAKSVNIRYMECYNKWQ